jgi:hypothetical protein
MHQYSMRSGRAQSFQRVAALHTIRALAGVQPALAKSTNVGHFRAAMAAESWRIDWGGAVAP